jgi:hypothetical protein
MSEKTRIIGTTSGALGLGAFAAAVGACCALPWGVALLGVGGAVALARLSVLLPYLLFGAAALLAVAFWWAYRPVASCAEGICTRANRRPLQRIVWVATMLVLLLAGVALREG